MVYGVIRIIGVTEDSSSLSVFFDCFRKGTDGCDGCYPFVHVVFLAVFSLALCPAFLVQLHRFHLGFPYASADLAL